MIAFVPLIVFGIGYVTLLSSTKSMYYGSDPSPMSLLFFIIGALLLLAFQILFFSYPYWVVDKDLGIGSSLSKAQKFSSRNLGNVIVFFLSALGINLLGALPCFLGLFVTVPMTWIAGAGLYRALASSVDS